VDPPRAVPIAGSRGRAQCDQLTRNLVGGHGDDPVAAHGQDRQGPGIVAGQHGGVPRPVTADRRDLVEVAARLLDRDDTRVLGQAQERAGIDVGPGSRRHVVDDDRKIALVGHRPEVRLQHPAVGPVVVRRHDEGGVGAELGRPAGRADRAGRVGGAGSGHDENTVARRARGSPRGGGDQSLALVLGEGGGFAGRAARDQPVDAGEDLPTDQSPERGLVERPVHREWGDEAVKRRGRTVWSGRRWWVTMVPVSWRGWIGVKGAPYSCRDGVRPTSRRRSDRTREDTLAGPTSQSRREIPAA
jgi:hypothetical protein